MHTLLKYPHVPVLFKYLQIATPRKYLKPPTSLQGLHTCVEQELEPVPTGTHVE